MIDPLTITAGISGIKFISDALKLKKDLVGDDESKEKISDALDKLDDTKGMVYDLRDELMRIQAENALLKKENSVFSGWEESFNKYELIETSAGAMVYKFKSKPPHYACTKCMVKKEIHILQKWNSYDVMCINCKNIYDIDVAPSINF